MKLFEWQATEQLNEYTGDYHDLALAHYKLARQQGETIDKSLDIVARKILVATSKAIAERTSNK